MSSFFNFINFFVPMKGMIFNLLTIISLRQGYGIMDRIPYFSNAYPTQWFLTFRNNEVFNRPDE